MEPTHDKPFLWPRLRRPGALAGICQAFILAVACAGDAQAEFLSKEVLDTVPIEQSEDYGFRNGSFTFAPIPFSNPTIGNGLAGGGAWLFKADPDSDTSTIGLGGFASDNGSRGVGLRFNLNLSNNRYKISFLAGTVDLTYDFTAAAFDIELDQEAQLYQLDLSYGVTPQLSAGVRLGYADTRIAFSPGSILPPEIVLGTDLEVLRYGLIANWDRRDSDIYPVSGTQLTLDAFYGDITGAFGRDYQKAVVQGSAFVPLLGEQGVLAMQGTICAATSGAPFYDACSIGLTDGLRGFSVTEYIGERLLSGQVEFRGRIGQSRFGYVAFAGAGSASGRLVSDGGLHGAAGIGARFRLSRSFPVDYSVDVTANSDGESFFYVYVGQSF